MTYYSKTFKDRELYYDGLSAVMMAVSYHHKALEAAKMLDEEFMPLLEEKPEKVKKEYVAPYKEKAPLLYASAFGSLEDARVPKAVLAREKNRRPLELQGVLKQYLAIDYDFEPGEESKIQQVMIGAARALGDSRYVIYPTSSFPWYPRLRLIVDVKDYLDESTYKQAVAWLIDKIGVDPGDKANLRPLQGMALPVYCTTEKVEANFYFSGEDKRPLSLDNVNFEVEEPITFASKPGPSPLDGDYFIDAFKPFAQKRAREGRLDDYEDTFSILSSLAAKVIDGEISYAVARECSDTLAIEKDGSVNLDWKEGNAAKLDSLVASYESRPPAYYDAVTKYDILKRSDFIYVGGFDLSSGSLGQALLKAFPSGDPKAPLIQVGAHLMEIFKGGIALMERSGSDAERLALFDPTCGLWVSDDDLLYMLADTLKPTLSPTNFQTLKSHLAASCRREGLTVSEYTGSRYIAFKNGVLDVATFELLSLASPKVRNLHLTSRSRLGVKWNPDAQNVTLEGKGIEGGDWDLDSYFSAYGDSDEDKIRFFKFILSLGLFGSHCPGVISSIVGQSGDGKTALYGFYEALYQPGQTTSLLFGAVNDPFPLSGYHHEKTVLWLRETNTGANAMSPEGIQFYDGLADGKTSLRVKHKSDFVFKMGPVFLDGTATIQAEEMDTGPGRRTLVYILPEDLKEKRNLYYSCDIEGVQQDRAVLEYFVKSCLEAYRSMVPVERMENFKLNLATKADQDWLPSFAKEWRAKLISVDTALSAFYEDRLKDYLIFDEPTALLTWSVLYELYLSWYQDTAQKDKSMRYAKSQESFKKGMTKLFEELSLKVYPLAKATRNGSYTLTSGETKTRYDVDPLLKIDHQDILAIDWIAYGRRYKAPDSLRLAHDDGRIFGKYHYCFMLSKSDYDETKAFEIEKEGKRYVCAK